MSLSLNEYQDRASATSAFPLDVGEMYMALKMCGEVGEVAEKILMDAPLADLVLELGDVLWYNTVLAKFLGFRLADLTEFEDFLETDVHAAKFMTEEMDGKPSIAALMMNLSVCAGAVAETIGKAVRDGHCVRRSNGITFDAPIIEALGDHLVSVYVAVTTMALFSGTTLEQVAERNIAKVESRRARNAVHGSGDNR